VALLKWTGRGESLKWTGRGESLKWTTARGESLKWTGRGESLVYFNPLVRGYPVLQLRISAFQRDNLRLRGQDFAGRRMLQRRHRDQHLRCDHRGRCVR
jgi:hypothetical protein